MSNILQAPHVSPKSGLQVALSVHVLSTKWLHSTFVICNVGSAAYVIVLKVVNLWPFQQSPAHVTVNVVAFVSRIIL